MYKAVVSFVCCKEWELDEIKDYTFLSISAKWSQLIVMPLIHYTLEQKDSVMMWMLNSHDSNVENMLVSYHQSVAKISKRSGCHSPSNSLYSIALPTIKTSVVLDVCVIRHESRLSDATCDFIFNTYDFYWCFTTVFVIAFHLWFVLTL